MPWGVATLRTLFRGDVFYRRGFVLRAEDLLGKGRRGDAVSVESAHTRITSESTDESTIGRMPS